jgi:putative FmdB family regulatory protein
MPIYEYQCPRCGNKFEVRQSIGEDGSKLNCPDCGTGNPERLISSFFSSTSSATGCSDASGPT